LLECLRQFVVPAVFQQAQRAWPRRRQPRWELPRLVIVLCAMTWCCGDSMEERFETAKAFYVACHAKGRRPGKTVEGFQMALGRLPMTVLRLAAGGVRRQIERLLGDRLVVGGFVPLGCDGTRLECPRSAELERRMGQAGKEHSAPTLWVTALVHLRWGLLWAWRLGQGTASETHHLVHLLATLPARALLVTDAAYFGYELARAVLAAGASFLMRVSSHTWLYTEAGVELDQFREGIVYYWPQKVQKRSGVALKLRLLRVRGRTRHGDVWLLTNVLGAKQLSLETAAQFYRWRWKNEGLFRTYKRTLHKVKLMSRTVRLVHREAEGSLLGLQVLFAQGTWRMPAPREQSSPSQPGAASAKTGASATGTSEPQATGTSEPRSEPAKPVMASPRRVLLEIRREILNHRSPQRRRSFAERLTHARRECRVRTSSKVSRAWPRRKDHQAPGAPEFRTLSSEQKLLISNSERTATQPIR